MTPGTRDLVRGALAVNARTTGARLDELVESIEAAEARFRAQHPGVAYDDDVKITSPWTAMLILEALPPDEGRWEMAF
jgi:3'-phosphoadenosine 5'-phosphosulfate sulfotransferase